MIADLRRLLQGTFLEGTPILPFSNVTDDGFDPFIAALESLVRSIPPRRADGVFRMPLDRAFSAKGFGTVVAGIPIAGSASLGGETVLLPQDLTSRIKRIEVYGQSSDTVLCGQCAAINLGHCDAKEIRRGDVLTLPGYFTPQEFYVCRLRILPLEKIALKSGAEVKLHTGTSEVNATLYPLESGELRGDSTHIVQFRTKRPIVAGPGDPFILRSFSPVRTIGGGTIIEAVPGGSNAIGPASRKTWPCGPRRSTTMPDSWNTPSARPRRWPSRRPTWPVRTKTLYPRLEEIVSGLVRGQKVLALPAELYLHSTTAAEAGDRLLGQLAEYHRRAPESPGHDLGAAWRGLSLAEAGVGRPGATVEKRRPACGTAINVWRGPNIGRPFKIATPPIWRRSSRVSGSRAFAPPSAAELAEKLEIPPAAIDKLLRILQEHQRLVAVGEGLLFHQEAVELARRRLVEHIREGGAAGERAVQVSGRHDAEVRPAASGLFRSHRPASPGGQHTLFEGPPQVVTL